MTNHGSASQLRASLSVRSSLTDMGNLWTGNKRYRFRKLRNGPGLPI